MHKACIIGSNKIKYMDMRVSKPTKIETIMLLSLHLDNFRSLKGFLQNAFMSCLLDACL